MERFEHKIRTMYSFGVGVGSPEEYVAEAKKIGMRGLGICDLSSASGLFHFYSVCKKEGVKPVLGIQLYLTWNCEKDHEENILRFPVQVIAKNFNGYRNILKISSLAYEIYRQKPILQYRDLLNFKDDLILIIPAEFIYKINKEGLDDWLDRIDCDFDDKYLELSPTRLIQDWNEKRKCFVKRMTDEQKKYNEYCLSSRHADDVKFLISSDVYYPSIDYKKIQDVIVLNSDRGKSGWHFYTETNYLMGSGEIYHHFKKTNMKSGAVDFFFNTAVQNGNDLLDSIEDYNLESLPVVSPKYVVDSHDLGESGMSAMDLILKIIKTNGKMEGKDERYSERLKYELKIIEDKKFIEYFLMIEDIIRFCDSVGIMVGPGRGSAAGSLLSYLLNITKIDPIRWDLPFERFIDVSRQDFPDIDIDFAHPDRVREYIYGRYGHDCAMPIAMFQQIKVKTAIKDACRAIYGSKFDYQEITRLTKGIPSSPQGSDEKTWFNKYLFGDENNKEEFPGDLELMKYFKKHDDVFQAVYRLVGKTKLIKVHPCAMVIATESVDSYVPTVINNINRHGAFRITAYDGKYVEKSGLLKFDILSLNTLRIIEDCLRQIAIRKGIEVDVWSLDPTDDKILKTFAIPDTASIFQYDTVVIIPLLKSMLVDRFEDLMVATSLGRPGPLGSGLPKMYIDRKLGKEPVVYAHPKLKEALGDTYGVIVYQEQVMKIFQVIGGVSAIEANQIRKHISKKNLKELETIKPRYLEHATEKLEMPLTKPAAIQLWNELFNFAKYSFNRCLSGSQRMLRPPCGSGKKNYSIGEMFKIRDSMEFAKQRGQVSLHRKYKRDGYGFALSMIGDRIKRNRIVDIRFAGIRDIYRVTMVGGETIDCTMNHKFPTPYGERKLESLTVGDDLYVSCGYEKEDTSYRFSDTKVGESVNLPKKGQRGFQTLKGTPYKKWKENKEKLLSIHKVCVLCGSHHRRMEVHHKDGDHMNNKLSNLLVVCPSCHKKEHYRKLGRIKVMGKGYPVRLDKIASIEYLETGETYDVEMEAPNHNLVVESGIVTSNSHSCSYAYLAYACQYLKVYYPQEWWVSVLKNADHEKIRKFVVEVGDRIKIIPPCVNASKADFDFNEDGEIVVPFGYITRVGESVVGEIIKGQPYSSLEDFYNRTNRRVVNKAVVFNLIFAGAFRNVESSRSEAELVKFYYSLKKEKLPEEMNFDDVAMVEKFKQQASDLYFTDWVDKFKNEFHRGTLRSFNNMDSHSGKTVCVGGVREKLEKRKTKTDKDYYRLYLGNSGETLTIFVWSKEFIKSKEDLAEGNLVEVFGHVNEFGITLNRVRQIPIK